MSNQTNSLPQSAKLHSRELVSHRLKPTSRSYPSPELEHWVLQMHGIDKVRLNDPDDLSKSMDRVVSGLKLTAVSSHSHFFGPGVSTVVILSESHLSAHTWPELGYLHIDLITCGRRLTQEELESQFSAIFNPDFIQLVRLEY